jgi:hypothetical protein
MPRQLRIEYPGAIYQVTATNGMTNVTHLKVNAG